MMVDWTISCPGNTPHVTAFTASGSVFVMTSPLSSVRALDHYALTYTLVGGIQTDQVVFPIQLLSDPLHLVFPHKKLYESLLEHVSASRSPSMYWIFTVCRIHSWLRSDCPVLLLIQSEKVRQDGGCLRRQRQVAEGSGRCRRIRVKVSREQARNITVIDRCAPFFQCLRGLNSELMSCNRLVSPAHGNLQTASPSINLSISR